jgi:hypothetical protein
MTVISLAKQLVHHTRAVSLHDGSMLAPLCYFSHRCTGSYAICAVLPIERPCDRTAAGEQVCLYLFASMGLQHAPFRPVTWLVTLPPGQLPAQTHIAAPTSLQLTKLSGPRLRSDVSTPARQ